MNNLPLDKGITILQRKPDNYTFLFRKISCLFYNLF